MTTGNNKDERGTIISPNVNKSEHPQIFSRIQPFSLGAIHSYAIFYLPRCCKVYNYQFGASFRHFRLKMAVIFYNYYIVRCRHLDRGETSLAEKD